jgi:hypothetical protein
MMKPTDSPKTTTIGKTTEGPKRKPIELTFDPKETHEAIQRERNRRCHSVSSGPRDG